MSHNSNPIQIPSKRRNVAGDDAITKHAGGAEVMQRNASFLLESTTALSYTSERGETATSEDLCRDFDAQNLLSLETRPLRSPPITPATPNVFPFRSKCNKLLLSGKNSAKHIAPAESIEQEDKKRRFKDVFEVFEPIDNKRENMRIREGEEEYKKKKNKDTTHTLHPHPLSSTSCTHVSACTTCPRP
ncbi:hypothetical protein K435DRAFT_877990 [Dendrothele bispora CBS 962.96]|uniref:Uncharacterized protein n=1 Tax=Dendrothele bispora (strain CBS 962.96) TaxID=1314807 RepID=A0A4S8KP82_DENBC|nr:hypothetical protein K435DRAFT_877990 [Dendrothele bispora CBS 962.96]